MLSMTGLLFMDERRETSDSTYTTPDKLQEKT